MLFGMEKQARKVVSGLQVLEGLSHQEGSRRRLRGAQVAKLGPVDKEKLSHRHAWAALKRSEGSVCLDRLPFSQAQGEPLRRQGEVGAGFSILRERGRRCQPQRVCRPGSTRSWLPPPRSTATPNLHSNLSPSYWAPCFHSCSSAAHSPERDFIKQTHLVQKPPAAAHCPLVKIQIYFSSPLPPFYSLKTEQSKDCFSL